MNTIVPTVFNNGVKRLQLAGLGAWGLGDAAAQDIADGMIGEGYDPGTINSLVAQGASSAQLQSLWDNTAPNTPDFSNAALSLLMQLSGAGAPPITGATMQTSAAGAAYGAASMVVQYGSQALDMSLDSSWQYLNSQFQTIQQQLNALVKQFPGDADVSNYVGQFNSLAMQFASAWQQAYGSSMAPAVVSLSGMGTLGNPLLIAGLVALVAGIAAGLYILYQQIKLKQTQAYTAQTQATSTAATASALTSTYQQTVNQANAALAAGNSTLYNQLMTQANNTAAQIQKLGGSVAPATLTAGAWFQSNWGWLALVFAGVVILPPLIKKI